MEEALMDTAQVQNNLNLNQIKNLIHDHLKRFKITNDELLKFMELCSKYNRILFYLFLGVFDYKIKYFLIIRIREKT